MSKQYQTIIVGGGLAGLYAAYRLQKNGEQDFVIVEANNRLGGRLQAFENGYDLGATWFWADLQPELSRLIDELGLTRFEQYSAGNLLLEYSADTPAKSRPNYQSSPPSYRLQGGMAAMISAMAEKIDDKKILLNHAVKEIKQSDNGEMTIVCQTAAEDVILSAHKILLALPPRLIAQNIAFSPALPDDLKASWQNTPTWMAAHAKYVAVYDEPFWRQKGLAGSAFSAKGVLAEMHDISFDDGRGCLKGFVSWNAAARQQIGTDKLCQQAREQLARLFGEQALHPIAETLKDWSADELTATHADWTAPAHHSAAPAATPQSGAWADKLVGVGSEFAPTFGGYLAGAVEAVDRAV